MTTGGENDGEPQKDKGDKTEKEKGNENEKARHGRALGALPVYSVGAARCVSARIPSRERPYFSAMSRA